MAHRFARLRGVGRGILDLYDRRPMLMSSIVGSGVFSLGELIVEAQKPGPFAPEWANVGEIGALGAVENGVLMTLWYRALATTLGNGVGTGVCLAKCASDQLVFATQYDATFLTLCAYQHSENLPEALEEVKKTFLSTWLNDCSVWPLLTFIGKELS